MGYSNAILVLKALDGLVAREIATAQNIANAQSPNYQPLQVSFEDALKAAAADGDSAVQHLSIRAMPAAAGTTGLEFGLGQELATASATALRYSALIEILDRQGQLQGLAVTGNGNG